MCKMYAMDKDVCVEKCRKLQSVMFKYDFNYFNQKRLQLQLNPIVYHLEETMTIICCKFSTICSIDLLRLLMYVSSPWSGHQTAVFSLFFAYDISTTSRAKLFRLPSLIRIGPVTPSLFCWKVVIVLLIINYVLLFTFKKCSKISWSNLGTSPPQLTGSSLLGIL